MIKQQSGFTLIELIMVIVVLGALAVSAIPRYVDLQDEADTAATDGIAGALAAGSAINYAACVAGDPACTNGAAMDNCDEVDATVAGGIGAYVITTTAFVGVSGDSEACVVQHPNFATNGISTAFSAINPG